jgi:hypothetical protein
MRIDRRGDGGADHQESNKNQGGNLALVKGFDAIDCSGAYLRPLRESKSVIRNHADSAAAERGRAMSWGIPSQDRIECSATNDDEIEIEQISPVHPDENVRIHVARSNAVRLARSVLFAAGFKSVLIATADGGGLCDLEDGAVPEKLPALSVDLADELAALGR